MIQLLISFYAKYRKQVLIAIATLAAVGAIYLRGCKAGRASIQQPVTASLPVGATEQITVDLQRNTIRVQTKDGIKQVQGVRNATVTVNKDGAVVLNAPNRGFVFEPGLAAMVDINGPRIGPDVCWAYIGRFDFLGGLAFSRRPLAVGYLALGFNPPLHFLTNTDVFVGYGTNKNVLFGVRVAF